MEGTISSGAEEGTWSHSTPRSIMAMIAYYTMRTILSPTCPIPHSPLFFHVFIISEAYGIGGVFVILGIRAFGLFSRLRSWSQRFSSRLHCIGSAFVHPFPTSSIHPWSRSPCVAFPAQRNISFLADAVLLYRRSTLG